jgi:dTDP-4-dehydrorhamnose reductase
MIDKIVIFGTNGMLGNYIYKYFKNIDYNIIAINRDKYEINVENISNIDNIFKEYNINENTCVINCIGLIPQRNSREVYNYYIINSIFPQMLSKVCYKYNTKLIIPTTDCVFSGNRGNYTEDDIHDENNTYGISKSLGEPGYGTIIRTSIIGEEKHNKYSFLEWIKNSKGEINCWDNHLWNGISCLQYCKIIQQIIDNDLFWNGIRHIYSPDIKSKYEMAIIIKDVYNLDIEINKSNTINNINKTLSSIYSTNMLFDIPDIQTQIKELKEFCV